jgi:hypothetical protein
MTHMATSEVQAISSFDMKFKPRNFFGRSDKKFSPRNCWHLRHLGSWLQTAVHCQSHRVPHVNAIETWYAHAAALLHFHV